MSSTNPHQDPDPDSDPELLDADDAEEVLEDGDGDVAMDSDDENEEVTLQNDSIAYFDGHKDSVFAIAQHPLLPHIVATGGSEGDADDAPGKGYVLNTASAPGRPVLPPSYAADAGAGTTERKGLEPVFAIDGHTDSITALAFTLPNGEFLVSGGMDGRLRAYAVSNATPGSTTTNPTFTFLSEAQETEDVTWLAACPTPTYDTNAIALGAGDGSVWVYALDAKDGLRMVASYFLHTGACTAGAWSPDGALLATVSEDGSLHVFDVWGAAGAKGLALDNGQTVVSLTEADGRFAVEGGLYSVAVAPSGGYLAVGGNGGAIRIVGLPRLVEAAGAGAAAAGKAKGKAGKQASKASAADPAAQAGAILASLNVQTESVESLSFSPAPATTLLAAGSVDGSIAVFDTARAFALRRHLKGAHEDHSVVKVEFVRSGAGSAAGWLLTSCGLDGVVRRWDLRGAATTGGAGSAGGLVKEWRGHRGDGEGGGVLGFVQGETGERVATAGDDSVVLIFEA